MRLLVSGATDTVRRHRASPHLGILLVPGAGNRIASVLATGLPWAADNAAFAGFDAAAFCALIARIAGHPGCLFVACPDVVADARATLDLFARWQPVLAALGLPVALVGQDGAEHLPLPWDRIRALFIGGSTEWKLGPGAASLVAEARRRGLWTHLGRCNTRGRFRYAFRLGCDSVDGSGFSRWPDERIPRALHWLAELHGTPPPEPLQRDFAHRLRPTPDGRSWLDQPGWTIAAVSRCGDEYQVRARFAVEPSCCPKCQADTVAGGQVYRHGVRPLRVRDVPRHGRPVVVLVERQRYRCRSCGRTFLQPLPGLCAHSRASAALAGHLGRVARCSSRSHAAREAGIDRKTLGKLLVDRPLGRSRRSRNAASVSSSPCRPPLPRERDAEILHERNSEK